MRKIYFIVFICSILFQSNTYSQTCRYLVWSDEFDVNGAPNQQNWGYDFGYIANNEFQVYVNSIDNARVENGVLVIEARKNTLGGWTSARLQTQNIHPFTYGRIEFRAKVPIGIGTWPALWMLGQSINSSGWPACGEIDIMEAVGKDPGVNHASLHTTSSSGNTVNTAITTVSNFSTAFHIYAVEWTDTKMDFYVDDLKYYTYSPSVKTAENWPFNNPFFIIMNVAMGGNWGSDPKYETGGLKNGIDPALTSVKMEIDYVRVYQTSAPQISGNKTVVENSTENYSVPDMPGVTYNWTVTGGAQIISGQGHNSIAIKWGSISGELSVALSQTCGNINTPSFPVKVTTSPLSDNYNIPNLDNLGNNLWQEVPTTGNTISFITTPDFQLNYNIQNAQYNPNILHPLTSINLTHYNYLSLNLKTDIANPPKILRLDLIDNQNRSDLDHLLIIKDFNNDDNYHTYSTSIASYSDFDLSAVNSLKMYVNYGSASGATNGKIWFKDVQLSVTDPLKIMQIQNDQIFKIYPNPAKEQLHIEPTNNILAISIINILSQPTNCKLSSDGTVDINSLSPGIYTLLITDNKNKKTALKFQKN